MISNTSCPRSMTAPTAQGLQWSSPAWMTYNMNHDVMRFAQVASRVWGCSMDFACPENTARAGIQCFRNYLKSIGMPGNFAELGAKAEDIPHMAHQACWGNGRTGTHRRLCKP